MQLKYFISLDKSKKLILSQVEKTCGVGHWSNYLLHECGLTWSAVCEISLSFNDALVRHYFDQSIGMISDHVTLTDAELISEYDSLKSEHQLIARSF